MHILNVARGGTLIQHLPDRLGNESHKPDPVKMTIHDVEISAASKLGRVLGATAQVPAAHHQAIDRIGSGLLTVAWTPDQVVEAVELQGHQFGIGVQWHPGGGRRRADLRGPGGGGQARDRPGARHRGDRPVQANLQAARRPFLTAALASLGSAFSPAPAHRSARPRASAYWTGGAARVRVPFQPRRRRTVAISAAVRQRCAVASGQPYRSVLVS